MERPKLLREWVGLRVALRDRTTMRSGVVFPKGAKGVVTSAAPGLFVQGDPCGHCGVSLAIAKLRPEDLEVIERVRPSVPARPRR